MALVESTVCRKIEGMHRARAELVRRTLVPEFPEVERPGDRLGDGEVLVFALSGHPSAKFCYAWEAEGRVKTALGYGPRRKRRMRSRGFAGDRRSRRMEGTRERAS